MGSDHEIELMMRKVKEVDMTEDERKSLYFQLLEACVISQSYDGQAYALYCIAELCYREFKYKKSLKFLQKGYEVLNYVTDEEQRIDYCILLGIIYTKLGNEQKAFDYFLDGMELSQKKNDYLRQGMLYCNIATLYAKLGAYQEALKHFYLEKQCYQQLIKAEIQVQNDQSLYLGLTINIGLTFCSLKNYKLAASILEEVEQEIAKHEEHLQSFYALKAKTYFGLKNLEVGINYASLFLELARGKQDIIDNYDDAIDIFYRLLHSCCWDVAASYLVLLKKTAFTIRAEEYQRKYYDALLQYELQIKEERGFTKNFIKFLAIEEIQEKEFREMKRNHLRDKKMIDSTTQLKKKIMQNLNVIKEQAEKDPLTQLANRYCLNEYCEKHFRLALEKGHSIGVDVLDIDYFKQYNDTFGHLHGDQCLIQVADALREAAGEYFIARFGGDEFFIVFYDISTKQILEVAKNLQIALKKRCIHQVDGLPYDWLTVSQGIVNVVPKAGQTMSDLIHSADNALYKGKSQARNTISLDKLL